MTRRGLLGALLGAAAAPKVAPEQQVAIRGNRYLSAVWTDSLGRVQNAEIDMKHYAQVAMLEVVSFRNAISRPEIMRALLDGRGKALDAAG